MARIEDPALRGQRAVPGRAGGEAGVVPQRSAGATGPEADGTTTLSEGGLRGRLPTEIVVGIVFVVGMFMSIMDSSIVNTALPAIARNFNRTIASTEWVVIGYLLSLAVCIPASGWMGDKLGTKKTFLFALCLFTCASALCGIAPSLGELVIFRVLQGVGGGMIAPVGQAMLFRAFPPARRAKASAFVALGTTLAPASGPVLGGVLVTKLSWRWCFYVNVPVGIAAVIFGLVFLHEHHEPSAGRFDIAGFVLAGAGLASLLYGVSEGPALGWGDPLVIVTALAGTAALAVLVLVELRQSKPMLALRLLRDRIFRHSNLVCLFSTAAFMGYLFVLPQFLQDARGASALSSGLTTFPGALGVITMSQVAGRVYPRVGPRRLMTGGIIGVATGFLLAFLFINLGTSDWVIRALAFGIGSCNAFVFIPMQAASFATISSVDTGQGSAIFNTQRQVAAACGVAILATIIASSLHLVAGSSALPAPAVQLVGYHRAFLAAGCLTLLGVIPALRVRDADAASTLRRSAAQVPAEV